MYDAVDVAAIPAGAQIVAGYVDGNWPTYNAVRTAFPLAQHVSITVTGRAGARVADVEQGDLTPQSGAHWAAVEIAAGRRPTLYYSRAIAGEISAALAALGIPLDAVDYWVADWTGSEHLVPGSVATQWASPATGSGGNFDISQTVSHWPTASQPAPGPNPPGPGPAPNDGGFMPPTVKAGDVSGAVRSVQALCNLHGSGLTVDGVFGPATEHAVKNFQSIFRLTVDGIVGPQTWTALDAFG